MSVSPAPCDTLISNAYVITMDGQRRIYPAGAIAIDGGRILDVGREADVAWRYAPRRTIDAGGAPVHPGFVESHVHLIHTARGAFPDSLPFDEGSRLYTRWWDAQTEEEDYAGSLLAVVEMLRNGVTCFMEAGTSLAPDSAARAAQDGGIRASLADPFLWDLGEGLSSRAPMTRAPVARERALAELGGQLWRNDDPDALVRGHVAVYGMGHSSIELQQAGKELAERHGVTFTQHQSFTPADRDEQRLEYGMAPLLRLADCGLLGPRSTFTHMNVLDDDEAAVVVESGMSIAWCVSSSMVWGAGGTRRGRHPELRRAGVNVGLGADAVNSSCRFDPGLQALLAVLTAREKTLDRGALGVEDALEMITIGGAKAVGREGDLGSLEPGKRADVVVRTRDVPEARPGLDPLQSIVFSAGAASVDTVLVGGEPVLVGRRTTKVDEREVYAKATEAAHAVMKRIGMSGVTQTWPEIV
jgi:cytosine/adenosine deaminase-related metal-dependent hydrolase